ncbi:MAG: aa3-type cytochrome c oxidase subunit IV [Hyphomicrobiales bacterium]
MAGKKSAMNYQEHEKTYNLFIAMSKYGTVAVIVILVLMAIFLL